MVSSIDFVEPADWTRRKEEFKCEAWSCLYQQAWIKGYVYGRQEEWNDVIVNLLICRFGTKNYILTIEPVKNGVCRAFQKPRLESFIFQDVNFSIKWHFPLSKNDRFLIG